MVVEEEDYLEHFGVRGMKWGQRKTHFSDAAIRANVKKKTEAVKVSVKKKTDFIKGHKIVLGTTAASAAVGAIYVRGLLEEKGLMRVADIINAHP